MARTAKNTRKVTKKTGFKEVLNNYVVAFEVKIQM